MTRSTILALTTPPSVSKTLPEGYLCVNGVREISEYAWRFFKGTKAEEWAALKAPKSIRSVPRDWESDEAYRYAELMLFALSVCTNGSVVVDGASIRVVKPGLVPPEIITEATCVES